jgi:flagellar L-ring protein precursor FlgH
MIFNLNRKSRLAKCRRLAKLTALALLSVSLTACNAMDRIEHIGAPPDHADITNPTEEKGYKPVSTPQPEVRAEDNISQPNSLWHPGSRAFFKDQRAVKVGDILTVKINITDAADVKNETNATRTAQDQVAMPNVFGLETTLGKVLPGAYNPASAVSTTTNSAQDGKGEVKRNESIVTDMAATIIQKLPNGNLVIQGTQEILVDNEMRQLDVRGIIRPEDIASDNTITHDKIADARITYGGKGQLADIQQARYGSQLLDVLSPF